MESILLTHAEVSVALAGFSSVAAVFQRPLGPVQRQRFLTILFTALMQLVGSLLPVWLSESYLAGPELWRVSSGLYLGLNLVIGPALFYPLRAIGLRSIRTINLSVTVLVYVLALLGYATLVFNLFVLASPGFTLYYASLLSALASIFIVFADVVTRGDETTA